MQWHCSELKFNTLCMNWTVGATFTMVKRCTMHHFRTSLTLKLCAIQSRPFLRLSKPVSLVGPFGSNGHPEIIWRPANGYCQPRTSGQKMWGLWTLAFVVLAPVVFSPRWSESSLNQVGKTGGWVNAKARIAASPSLGDDSEQARE